MIAKLTPEARVALESFKPSTYTKTDDEARRIAGLYEIEVTIYKTRSGTFTLSQPKPDAFGKWGSVHQIIDGTRR